MGQFTKKIEAHDSTFNDYFKNELGKAITTVDVAPEDTTIDKKSEDRRQIKIAFRSNRINPDNSRTEFIRVSALPGSDFAGPNDFLNRISSQISGTFLTHDIESTLPYRSQTNNQAEYFYSLRSKYNYYASGYEQQANNVSERLLPNFYIQKSTLDEQKSNFSNPNESFFKSIGTTQSIIFPPIKKQET